MIGSRLEAWVVLEVSIGVFESNWLWPSRGNWGSRRRRGVKLLGLFSTLVLALDGVSILELNLFPFLHSLQVLLAFLVRNPFVRFLLLRVNRFPVGCNELPEIFETNLSMPAPFVAGGTCGLEDDLPLVAKVQVVGRERPFRPR